MQKTKNILLTGTAGFIGSNFVPYWKDSLSECLKEIYANN